MKYMYTLNRQKCIQQKSVKKTNHIQTVKLLKVQLKFRVSVYGLGYVLAKMSSCIAQYYCLLVARRATAAVSDKQGRV